MAALLAGIALLAAAAYGSAYALAQLSQPPEQPIRFPHEWHVRSVGIECSFCHRTAATNVSAGIPALQQCMFCHRVAGARSQEVQKLRAAFDEGRPINWVQVYRVPDHVRFTHAPHAAANVDCQVCHGDVRGMTLVRMVRPLKMGDCVGCHRRQNAATNCWACHY